MGWGGALRLVAVVPGAYKLLLGKAFGLVGLTEDVRVREESRLRGPLVSRSLACTLGHLPGGSQ